VLVPYSKYQVVVWPFGLTVPFITAELASTRDATPVVTVGADEVLNDASAPRTVPASLWPTMR